MLEHQICMNKDFNSFIYAWAMDGRSGIEKGATFINSYSFNFTRTHQHTRTADFVHTNAHVYIVPHTIN